MQESELQGHQLPAAKSFPWKLYAHTVLSKEGRPQVLGQSLSLQGEEGRCELAGAACLLLGLCCPSVIFRASLWDS